MTDQEKIRLTLQFLRQKRDLFDGAATVFQVFGLNEPARALARLADEHETYRDALDGVLGARDENLRPRKNTVKLPLAG